MLLEEAVKARTGEIKKGGGGGFPTPKYTKVGRETPSG